MMASYFQLVLEAKAKVGTIIRSHSRVLLNEGQCEWLEARLREAVECAQDAFSTLSTQRFEQLLRNFYLKVKDVEILVGQCCAEPWLTNAFMFADIEEYFVLKGRELGWFRALFKHVKQGSESGVWLEGVPRWDWFELEEDDHMEVRVRELEDNAQEDRGKLRRNLEEVIMRSASVADCSPARYLLNKLEMKLEQSRVLEKPSPHVMWKVDPKELEYGKCIGSGASGKVYEVKWLKQPFAMKVFYVSHERTFEQEAAILAVLQHPHILPMVCSSIDSENGNCSLVTELMSEDLHNFMFRKRSVSLPVALDLMLQVAEGMQFLHKKRVVHKDLKSSNILVRPVDDPNLASEGFVCAKVTDFGLSKSKEESATRSQLTFNTGTTRWMAPELLKVTNVDGTSYSLPFKELCYPFKVDVYSYAITFHEVLTGKSPYHNLSSNTEIKKKVMAEYLRPELPVTCPISLATLIVKCWDEDAGQRPSFAEIFKELRHIKGQVLMGEPSFALEPLSELYKIVAGERPFISSSCPEPLAAFMERFRKMETRPSRQNICNALRHIQGLLFTEGITGCEEQRFFSTVGPEVGEGLGVLVGLPTIAVSHGKGVAAPAVETMEFGRPVQLPAVAFVPVEGDGRVETVNAQPVQSGPLRTVAGGSSSQGQNIIPAQIIQVHQLFPLDGDTCEVDVDVIFFHGLQQRPGDQSWKSSWVQRGRPDVCWPQEWLRQDLYDRVRVLSLEYDAQIMEDGGGVNVEDVHNIGANLRQTLVNNSQWQLGRHRPVVLVGHSFGGLVIKSLVIEVHKASTRGVYDDSNLLERESVLSAKAFLAGLKGIVFYAVPHGGANMGEIYKYWSVEMHFQMAGIVKNLKPCQSKMESLSTEFDEVVSYNSLNVCAFGEGRPLEEGRPVVVEYASAKRSSSYNNYKVKDANHFEVCQPHAKLDISYKKLVEFVKLCIHKVQSEGIDYVLQEKIAIGLGPHVEKVMEILELREPQRVQVNLGVVGMGGLGKTTLVEEVYKRTHTSFSAHYFLHDVIGKCSNGPDGLVELQKEVLHGLCKYKGKIRNFHEGKAIIRQQVTNLKVLLVLDDVDTEDQLDAFLVKEKIFGEGSRVIVTSRMWDVLCRYDESICRFDMEGLGVDHAMELFCLHAFKLKVPKLGFKKMSKEVVATCDGLPLSLKVMGACLYMYSEASIWLEVLRKLKKAEVLDGRQSMESRLWSSLRISLDTLDTTEKDMFLDIVCFFNKNTNVRRETASRIWGSKLELQTLIGRSLVKINDKDLLVVDNQLRDLGRKIVEEEYLDCPGKRSRLWDVAIANEAFASGQLSSKVRALALEGPQENIPSWAKMTAKSKEYAVASVHEDLLNLKLLTLTNVSQKTFQWFLECHPCTLQWLFVKETRQGVQRHLQAIPGTIDQLLNLKVLRVEGCARLKEVPESLGELTALLELRMVHVPMIEGLPMSIGFLTNLKSLELSWILGLVALPESVGQLTNLTSLQLSWCTSFAALPKSVGKLTNLTSLDLSHCKSLGALPKSIGQLTNLTSLDLSHCGGLAALPESVGQLTNLTSLNLSWCESLAALPAFERQLTNLISLDLSHCGNLATLPESVGKLTNLTSLNLSGCGSLVALPESVGQLTNLTSLDFSWCGSLAALPESIGQLTNLTSLQLSWCTSFAAMPESVGHLTNLTFLDLSHCKSLAALSEAVGQLTNLIFLDLSHCTSLATLPEFVGQLTNLTSLKLSGCESLTTLPKSVGQLTNLTTLYLSSCWILAALSESIGQLTNLTFLDLSCCGSLAALPKSVGQLTNLTSLDLSECWSLAALPESIGQLTNLTSLNLSGCESLAALPEFVRQLTNLTSLYLSHCESLATLPEFVGQLTNLTSLKLYGLVKLAALPESVGQLTNLTSFYLASCSRLVALPKTIGQLTNLSSLDLSCCGSLVVLPKSVGQLTNLTSLDLSECWSLAGLPDSIGQSTNLTSLELSGCESLATLPESISQLTNLTFLYLSHCGSLAALPVSVGQLTNLTSLYLSHCGSLATLPVSVGQLTNLTSLALSSCRRLAALPESIGQLTNLTSLDLSCCGSLAALPESIGQLTNLTSLDLSECWSLATVPESIGQLVNLTSPVVLVHESYNNV